MTTSKKAERFSRKSFSRNVCNCNPIRNSSCFFLRFLLLPEFFRRQCRKHKKTKQMNIGHFVIISSLYVVSPLQRHFERRSETFGDVRRRSTHTHTPTSLFNTSFFHHTLPFYFRRSFFRGFPSLCTMKIELCQQYKTRSET